MPVSTLYFPVAAGSMRIRAATAQPEEVDNDKLASYIDVFILAAIGLFVLLRLPRTIARLSRAAEWTHGYVLRSTVLSSGGVNFVSAMPEKPIGDKVSSDDSHTLHTHNAYVPRLDAKRTNQSSPPHIASSPAIGRSIVSALRYPFVPGVSIGQLFVLLGYTGALAYHATYMNNIFSSPKRLGYVAMAQIPFVFAFAQKNNVVGWLLAVGYEKLNFLHRFVGRALILAANVHGVGYTYQWLIAKDFQEKVSDPSYLWAFIALAALDILFISSHSFFRQKFYTIFITSHVLCFTLFLVAVCYHKQTTIPYVLTAAGLYGLDQLWRIVKTRFARATIRPLPELSLTRVEIPRVNAGWRAGQHVRLRVLSSRMGLWGWAESHPFTIASVSGGQEGLVLMCKKAGGWTGKLYQMAQAGGYGESGKDVGRSVSVMLEGPYGGPGNTVFASYSAAVFVAGGSGVTFALSAIQELIQQGADGRSRVKSIELVWSVQDPASMAPMLPLLTAFIQESVSTPVKISVFYTRAVVSPLPMRTELFHPGLTLTPGRPKLGAILDSVITDTVSWSVKYSQRPSGVVVGVCGPGGLGEEASRVIRMVDADRRDAAGGVELHEETFGW